MLTIHTFRFLHRPAGKIESWDVGVIGGTPTQWEGKNRDRWRALRRV
jgi:hypothetical protein